MKKQTKKNKQIEELAKRAARVLAQLEDMKPLYNEMDKITEEFLKSGLDQVCVEGFTIQLVDNFHSKNTVFKTTSVKRYELKKVG